MLEVCNRIQILWTFQWY